MARDGVVLKYYLYQATTTFGFFWPVFTLFLLHRGLSFAQIGLLGSISAALMLVGEVPTGYVGDRLGRRASLVLGSLLLSTSLLGFVVAQSFVVFVALYAVWAVGRAFRSGSADAWLYDVLDEADRAGEYTRVRGRGGSVGHWVSAATMLVAGVLYGLEPWLPFLASALLVASSIPVLVSMPAARGDVDGDGPSVVRGLRGLRRHLATPPLRSFVLAIALFFGVVGAADTFIQPLAVRQGLPESGLGPLYAGFTVVAAIGSYYAGDLEARTSTRTVVVAVTLGTALFLLVPLFLPLAVFPAFFAMKGGRAVVAPVASGSINDRAGSVQRATLLSAASMVYALVRVVLKPAAGALADATSPLLTIGALGAFFVLAALALSLAESPFTDD